MHLRSQIRAAIVAAIDARSALEGRVFSTRLRSTGVAEMPAAIVYVLGEKSEHIDVSMGLARTAQVFVDIKGKATSGQDLGDVLDALCAEVEAGVYADPTLGGLAVGLELQETGFKLDGSGNERDGDARLVFAVLYHTERPRA